MPDSSCVTEIQYRFDSETYGIFRAIQERHFQHHPQPQGRAGQGRNRIYTGNLNCVSGEVGFG